MTKNILAFIVCLASSFSFGNSPNQDKFDVSHYNIDLDLTECLESPYRRVYDASVEVDVVAVEAMDEMNLNASNFSLDIKDVSGGVSEFRHAGELLQIKLDRTYAEGDTVRVSIKYKHKDVKDSAFYCNKGMVYTDSESAGARNWFPCKDVPDDKATVMISALVPAGVQFCANGLLTDSIPSDDNVKYVYSSSDVISTYLIAFVASEKFMLAVDKWKFKSPDKGMMEIKYYYQRGETMFNLRNVMSKTLGMLDYFSEIYCDYPFEKLAFATTDNHFPWGGMENQTIVTLCPDCWIEDLICHELVHHWFGNMISPRTWADIWLNEGFATYNEALWFEHKYGRKKYKEAMEYEAYKYLNANPGWPIYNSSWNTDKPNDALVFEPAITYSKSGCVLYMLRYVLGDEVFFQTLKQYANDSRFRYGNVDTEQFKNFVEETSGVELDWFFDQWIYGPDHPVYELNHFKEKTPEGKWKVEYTIIQKQRNAGFFRMPVEIEAKFSDGSTATIKEENTYNMQTLELTFDKEPVSLRFDPLNKIILKEVR